MRSPIFALAAITVLTFGLASCGKTGKSKGVPDNGQLMGATPSSLKGMEKPYGMVYIPSGMFHMGPSDEDVNYNFTARNKAVSISGFWMDATK
jgi:formylglycine-generating enzyme required for sulfatase activity